MLTPFIFMSVYFNYNYSVILFNKILDSTTKLIMLNPVLVIDSSQTFKVPP